MLLADSWYASGTFWGAAGAIAVLLTGGIATIVAVSIANPVRRLLCVMSASPLLHAPEQGIPGRLQVTWNGTELQQPSVLDVSLTNRGRRDISRDDFDVPLELNVHAKIVAVLATTTKPDKTTFSAISFEGEVLKVGPGLIRRHQTVSFSLLAVGAAPTLTSPTNALREVDVVLATDQAGSGAAARVRVATALAVTAAVAGLVLIGLLIGHAFLPRVNQVSAGQPPRNSATAAPSATAATSAAATPSASAKTSATPSASGITSAPVSPQLANSLRVGESDLTSGQTATQFSGISLLQSVMRASSAEQPTVLQSLAKFIRDRSPSGGNDQPITLVIQAAVNVLRSRNPADDDGTVIDLTSANLTNANLTGIVLDNAILLNADFDEAVLNNASLKDANLNYAYLGGATLAGANLTGANLNAASFYQTMLCNGSKPTEPQRAYDCSANG